MAKVKLTSPRGIASYPHLNKADFKFDENGVWKTDLIVPVGEETEAFCDAVKEIAVEAFGKKASEAHLPFFPHAEDDTKVVLRFSTKHEPKLADVHGKSVSRNGLPMIGSGSTLKIKTVAESWEGKGRGVKLYLNGAQIIDLVEYGDMDFDDEGEGWEPEMADTGFTNEAGPETPEPDAAPAPKTDGKGYGF